MLEAGDREAAGYVFGVGLELALACDFRIAAAGMQMALPEATIGMIPGSGGTQRLARLVGMGRAKDIIMRGRRVEAVEAQAIGLVTEVVAPDELDATVDALISELSRHAPLSLAMAKRVLNTVYDGPLHVGLELEGLAYGLLQQTHDFHEGVEAFVEKRKPEFDGSADGRHALDLATRRRGNEGVLRRLFRITVQPRVSVRSRQVLGVRHSVRRRVRRTRARPSASRAPRRSRAVPWLGRS